MHFPVCLISFVPVLLFWVIFPRRRQKIFLKKSIQSLKKKKLYGEENHKDQLKLCHLAFLQIKEKNPLPLTISERIRYNEIETNKKGLPPNSKQENNAYDYLQRC